MNPTFSILVSARKNSKYLAKFLLNLLENTSQKDDIEILVMMNEGDTWNSEAVSYFSRLDSPHIKFYTEDYRLGRAGLHVYFNDLLKHANGQWIAYFCEDHSVMMKDWDMYVRGQIFKRNLDHRMIYSLVPKFDNVGAMMHILSKAYVEELGHVGRHGWIDSYINDVNHFLPQSRVVLFDDETFHDFTHDKPNPMSDEHGKIELSTEVKGFPKYATAEVRWLVKEDAHKLNDAIAGGK